MQLNLFEDNRTGILLNIADEFIRDRDLVQALSVYEQLLADNPADRQIAELQKLVAGWRDLLATVDQNPGNPTHLHAIWLGLDALCHPALRPVVLEILIDALRALPVPEQTFIPPRFHLGQVLMTAGRYAEAADCFQATLANANSGIERGRLLAWCGDALSLAGNDAAALKSYLAAFLEDPLTVEMQAIKNRIIIDLNASLHFEGTDEIEDDQAPAWLPVWGWLQGIFALPPQPVPQENQHWAEAFAMQLAQKPASEARIWFDMLIHAERVRLISRDSQELGAVRRLMKNTNRFMFDCYLEKISTRSPAIK